MVVPFALVWPLLSLVLVQGLHIPLSEQLAFVAPHDGQSGRLRRFVVDRSDDHHVLDIVEDLQVSILVPAPLGISG